jgi:hypothetical protein
MRPMTKLYVGICCAILYLVGVGAVTAWGATHWTNMNGKPDSFLGFMAGMVWPISAPIIVSYEIMKPVVEDR